MPRVYSIDEEVLIYIVKGDINIVVPAVVVSFPLLDNDNYIIKILVEEVNINGELKVVTNQKLLLHKSLIRKSYAASTQSFEELKDFLKHS